MPAEDFKVRLERSLRSAFSKENAKGDHTYLHTGRMKKMGPRLQGTLGANGRPLVFDLDEYFVAVDLHNLDASLSFKREIKERGYRAVCERLLAPGPFNAEAKERIIRAVTEHSKKDDEPGDSDLSVALRSADKIDRFAPSMLPGCGTCNPNLLAYDDSPNPFWGGEGTREGEVKTQYKAYFRNLEWYGMLPSDEARALVNPRFLKLIVEFLRCFGSEIAGHLGIPNRAEDDIRMAFGKHYEHVLTIVGGPK